MSQLDTRGQSGTVGSILLIGMVIVSITLAGGAATFNYINQESTDEPLTSLEIKSSDEGDVIVNHMGGEPLDIESTVVIVEGSIVTTFAGADSFDGERDGLFNTGESISHSLTNEGTVEALVVDKNSGEIVASETITLTEGGQLWVENFTTPDEAEEGEEITVSAEISNTGDGELTQDVMFSVKTASEEIQEIDKEVTISGGENTVVEFDYTIIQEKDIQVRITTEDDDESAEIDVEKAGELKIEAFTAPEVSEEGEEIVVSAEIDNTGDVELTQEVLFSVNGDDEERNERVTVPPNGTEVNFVYEPESVGEIEVRISTDDDEDSDSVEITPKGPSSLVSLTTLDGEPFSTGFFGNRMNDISVKVPESSESDMTINIVPPVLDTITVTVSPGDEEELDDVMFFDDSFYWVDNVVDNPEEDEVTIETRII